MVNPEKIISEILKDTHSYNKYISIDTRVARIERKNKKENKDFETHNCSVCHKRFAHAERGTNSPPWICRECNP